MSRRTTISAALHQLDYYGVMALTEATLCKGHMTVHLNIAKTPSKNWMEQNKNLWAEHQALRLANPTAPHLLMPSLW